MLCLVPLLAHAENSENDEKHRLANRLFVTWEGSEPDKGASLWLIRRFIAPDAEIRMVPTGALIEEGVAFDTPEARFRRTPRHSTYEVLLSEYKVSDPTVQWLGRIIHDLEINVWSQKQTAETEAVERAFLAIREPFGERPIPMECHIAFFDIVYDSLKSQQPYAVETRAVPEECKG